MNPTEPLGPDYKQVYNPHRHRVVSVQHLSKLATPKQPRTIHLSHHRRRKARAPAVAPLRPQWKQIAPWPAPRAVPAKPLRVECLTFNKHALGYEQWTRTRRCAAEPVRVPAYVNPYGPSPRRQQKSAPRARTGRDMKHLQPSAKGSAIMAGPRVSQSMQLSSAGRPQRSRVRALVNSPCTMLMRDARQDRRKFFGTVVLAQACWRARMCRRRYVRVLRAVLTLQCHVRGNKARRARRSRLRATIVLQAGFRGHKALQVHGRALGEKRAARQKRSAQFSRSLFVIANLRHNMRARAAQMRAKKEEAARYKRNGEVLSQFKELSSRALHETRARKSYAKAQRDWVLKWGSLELSQAKVDQLRLEKERIRKEWEGGRIVRVHDGSFHAAFDPGDIHADWLAEWMAPDHYSHYGRGNQRLRR